MSDSDHLTASDIALLHHVADGWSTRRISQHTSRSLDDVRSRLRAIRDSLEAKNNGHAVVIALRRGII